MKRAIALFLTLIFVFGLIPVSALAAAGTLNLTVDGVEQTIASGQTVTIPAATVPEGKAFKEWEVTGTGASLVDNILGAGFDEKNGKAQTCPVTVADDTVESLILTAKFVDTQFEITGPSGVVVSVIDSQGSHDDAPDKKLPYLAEEGNIIRVRAEKGDGKSSKLDSVTVKTTSDTTLTCEKVSEAAATATTPGYEIWEFTMVDESAAISVNYRYAMTVVGATFASGTDGVSESSTKYWQPAGKGKHVVIKTEDGKTVNDILNWTSSPSVTFTPDTTDPKTKATFDMPAKPVTIFVNYDVNHVLTVTGAGAATAGIDESGTIKVGDNSVKEGATISVKPKLNPGEVFVDWTVKPTDTAVTTKIEIAQQTEDGLVFTMPKFDVKIACNITKNQYNLYLKEAAATGSTPAAKGNNLVTVGNTVTLVAPEVTGKTCTGWAAQKDDGSSIDLTALEGYGWNEGTRTLTFKMPAYNVVGVEPLYVEATYKLLVKDAKSATYQKPTETIQRDITIGTSTDIPYGATVTITPETTGVEFFEWDYTTRGIAEPANVNVDETTHVCTFTMPVSGTESGGAMTVTAKYKYLATLTTDGTGKDGTISGTGKATGYFAAGTTVTITAGAANIPNNVFAGWEVTVPTSGNPKLGNANEAITTFVMPKEAVTVKASYAAPITVTMNNGSTVAIKGTSAAYATLNVPKGKELTATAAATYNGNAFNNWTATGITLTAEEQNSRVLNFTMPDAAVTLTPNYVAGRTVTVTNGTVKSESDATGVTSGTFAEGKKVTITASAISGMKFLHWNFVTRPVGGAETVTAIADTSSYTFTIAANTDYFAVAYYETLYSLTLQNYLGEYTVNNGKHLKLNGKETADGAGTISEYFTQYAYVSIEAPEKIRNAENKEVTFTNWLLVSGSGTLADAKSAKTTFAMTTTNVVLAAQYGGNVLIYKDAERAAVKDGNGNVIAPATIFYNNWTYENYPEGTVVSLTASEDDGNAFTGWICQPSDLVRKLSADGKTITFNMPAGVTKVYPSYEHKLTMTDGMYSLDGGTSWTRGEGEGKPINVPSGTLICIKPLDQSMAAPGDGTYTFSNWSSNSSRVGYQYNKASTSFTMPPEDVEITCNYQTYTLYVQRTVNHAQETYKLRPGQYITLDSGEATGGRQFNYWTHTDGLLFTVNDKKFDEKYPGRLISQRITVQMPSSDAFISAWFSAFDNQYYWSTDAFIKIQGEPKRYYALLESFEPYSMEVVYYPGAGEPGNIVHPNDYRIDIVKAGTFDTSGVDANGMFVAEGAYDLLVTMYVDGVQWAPTIRVMNDAYTHLYCSAEKPEFVRTFTKPAKTVYYEGETVVKDGLDIQLLSVNHVTGTLRYSVQRELAESEYQLYPRCYVNVNGNGDAEGLKANATTKLPTIAEIEKMIGDGTAGVKVQNGKYYVQMWVYCLNSSLLDTDGNPTIMQYLINDEADKIWVEVRRPLASLQLTAEKGVNLTDVVSNVPSTTYPYVSWEIEMLAGMGERRLTISAPGSTLTDAEIASAIEIENSDPNVAYLVDTAISTPLLKKLIIKAPGVTTITVKARGSETVKATCEVTVKSSDVVEMTGFTSLNKRAMSLFVGNTFTLAPYEYAPADANTACKWEVYFKDGLTPQNADYYVSVNEGGVVKVLKPTDRTVIVAATPLHWDKINGRDDKGQPKADAPTVECEVTVIQVPVDNMTISAATKTMYRLSSTKLKVALYPEAASYKEVIWTSSDSSIVSVDNDGNLTAHKLGTATITATAASSIPENGDMTKAVFRTCAVTVQQSVLLTGLMLNKTNVTLGIDDTIVLSPYYTPTTATTQGVTWTSSDTAIATVDSNGKVRGLADGAVLITATANDGSGLKASCVVTVTKIIASAVVLNKQTLALIEDETETLAATVYPTNASNNKVLWSSSNENVATVDPDGVVTGTGGGSAVITATAKDASTKYADCVVAVTAKIPVTAIALNLGNFDMLLNDTTVLTPTVSPANATYKLTWTSSDASVASVDEKGKVSALKTGSAVITCKAGDMTKAITVSVVTKTYSTGKVVNCARRVNVRANSSGGSTIVGYAYLGDVYKVLDKAGNWYKIQYNASTTAFIWHRYLSATETGAGYVSAGKVGATTGETTGTATPAPVVTAKTLTIANCTYCVNVRSGAGTNFSRLGYAYLDESFTYTGTSGDWYIITYNGATAYVSSQFVKVNN